MLTAAQLARLTDAELAEYLTRLEEFHRFQSMSAGEEAALQERLGYETSLANFARRAWDILEPGTALDWSWHYDLLCEFLTLVAQRKVLRGIINVPPRTAKSFFCTIVMPCWVWTWQPEHRFLFASHAASLSTDHSVKRRLLIESEWYQRLWGARVQLSADQNEKRKFTNTRTGSMFSTSVGGTVTGQGGNTLILDDGLSPEQARSKAETETCNEWIDNTWLNRFNDPSTGAALIVEQRTSLKDPTGSRLEKEPAAWHLLKIPLVAEKAETYVYPLSGAVHTREAGDVLQPARFTPAVVESKQKRKRTYQTQDQQSPTAMQGGVYQVDWWRYYKSLPTVFDEVTASWDMAFKGNSDSDFVVGEVWARRAANHYLLTVVRKKMSFSQTLAEVLMLKARYPATSRILVEAKANGPAIVSMLRDKISGLVEVEPQGSKYARAEASSADVESGNVFLEGPEAETAPQYVLDFVSEHTDFTGNEGEEDDQVDAQSQYLNWQRMRHTDVLDVYTKRAAIIAAQKNAGRLTRQQIQDAQPLPWSNAIKILQMGITPTEGIDRWELERWALDCRERGAVDQADRADELLETL